MPVILQESTDAFEIAPVLSPKSRGWRLLRVLFRIAKSTITLHLKKLAMAKDRMLHKSPSSCVINIEPYWSSTITKSSLTELVETRNINELLGFGWVGGMVEKLESHVNIGIQGKAKDIDRRRKLFGSNTYQKPSTTTWLIGIEVCKDPTILLLLLTALVSIVFGIKHYGVNGCIDGGSIFVAIFLVAAVSALSNLWPKRQFNKLALPENSFSVNVIRNGKKATIKNSEVVVGDIVCLKVGDQVPANGLLVFELSKSLTVDVSDITGETGPTQVNYSYNPFLFSGSEVVDGNARMLVTSVGMNTKWGQMMSSRACRYIKKTPLQEKLEKLTFFVAKIGLTDGLLVLIILLIRYFCGNMHGNDGRKLFIRGKTSVHDMLIAVAGICTTALVIASTAVPQGLLLAVAVAIAYAIKRMADDNNALVRDLSACEAISSTTVICTEKRGLNHVEVEKVWLGSQYVDDPSVIAPHVLEMLLRGVGLGSNVVKIKSGSLLEVFQNFFERAICSSEVQKICVKLEHLNASRSILQVEASNPEDEGAAEVIMSKCSHYVEDSVTGRITSIDSKRADLRQIVQGMKGDGLLCIAFAYKQIPEDRPDDGEGKSYILLGLLGVKEQYLPRVKESILECQRAKVDIKMITRAEVPIARAAAIQCGILEPNQDCEAVVDGMEFRSWTHGERMEKVDKIRVMARASSMDKIAIVKCLKLKGEAVAVFGESIGDAKAFGEADVGLASGRQGTNVAKAYADIVILDDSFVSIAGVLRWGRCNRYSIEVYGGFVLTVTIASLMIDSLMAISTPMPPSINIVAAISSGKVPFAALQILWVNFIVNTLAALALVIVAPTGEITQKPPADPTGPFVTNIMWWDIVTKAIYPVIILLMINIKGESVLKVNAKVNDTLIFNTFVLWQLFLLLATRKFEENAFKEVRGRKLFWVNVAVIFLGQVLMVEFLKAYAKTERLNVYQWSVSIVVAAFSWPYGWVVKSIPVPKVFKLLVE